jgi:N-acetylmuramoyl-L-alanine amidase
MALAAGLAVAVAGISGAGLALATATHQRQPHATSPSTPPAAPTLLAASARRPVVYVQAGHQAPGEPGYLAQTGAGGGPFGTEVAFNIRLAAALETRLRAAGVVVRHTPARVTPWGAPGAVFISVHFDSVGGSAGIGYAVDQPGRGENYYHGEGTGTASPVPYRDSAHHRGATKVTAAVQARSLQLARDLAASFRPIFTAKNGAHSHFRGVEPSRRGNARMQFFYGYYRVNTGARVLIECGAAGADNTFLRRTSLIATSVSQGILSYLRQTHQLGT